jgi:hypothetical protein
MKNAVTFIAVVGLVVVGVLWRLDRHRLQQQNRTIDELNAQLKADFAVAGIELQEKCARQAREEFKSEGFESEKGAEFSSHFNRRMGKCFVLIQNSTITRNIPATSKTLLDAYEGRVYAEYVWSNSQGKKYWEVAPMICDVVAPSGEKQVCHSDDEFEESIKIYMEGSTL